MNMKKTSPNIGYQKLSIIDSQAHIGPGNIEETLAAMDALGIQTLIIDELWVSELMTGKYAPVEMLENGVTRPISPTAELAAALYPDRFAYMLRISYNDPEAEAIIRMKAADPGCCAFRIDPGLSKDTVEVLANGGYDHIFRGVAETGKPLCIYLPDHPELIAQVAEANPSLTIIVDHCGLYGNGERIAFSSPYRNLDFEETEALFDQVLALSQYENVYLKWSHASENFDTPIFPGDDLRPLLRKAIDAFGAERILWASDFSVNQRGESWAELLYSVIINDDLSEEEKQAILGGNAGRLMSLD